MSTMTSPPASRGAANSAATTRGHRRRRKGVRGILSSIINGLLGDAFNGFAQHLEAHAFDKGFVADLRALLE